MPTLKEILSPVHQNAVQRRGFFASFALASLVLLLHFPFDGYDNEHYVTTYTGHGQCPPTPTIENLKKMTAAEIVKHTDDYIACSDRQEIQIRSFFDWRSKAPIVEWFGSVVHSTFALVFIFLLGGMWLWVFKTHDDSQPNHPN